MRLPDGHGGPLKTLIRLWPEGNQFKLYDLGRGRMLLIEQNSIRLKWRGRWFVLGFDIHKKLRMFQPKPPFLNGLTPGQPRDENPFFLF